MGRLTNLNPKTFFTGGKVLRKDFETNHTKECLTELERSDDNDEERVAKKETRKYTENTTQPKTISHIEESAFLTEFNALDINKQKNASLPLLSSNNENDNSESESCLREKIQHLKRNFIYEQNGLIEKCELEKFELRESYEEENTRLKRAFENEKTELLKEIERKDKMLHELARVLKEEYDNNLDSYKSELLKGLEHKASIIVQLQCKMNCIMENLAKIVTNNECCFQNMFEFKLLKSSQEEYVELSKSLKPPELKHNSFERCRSASPDNNVEHLKKRGILTRTFSNPETNKALPLQPKKVRSVSTVHRNVADDLQLEMAEEYRKQKMELVKLFNAEKVTEQQRLGEEKKKFEKEVRTEYEFRMSVERKAWQETIEDMEREIKILKYEREQMDHNYCVGMDEMKTEFEKEKQTIYRRYSEQQTFFEMKLKEVNKKECKKGAAS